MGDKPDHKKSKYKERDQSKEPKRERERDSSKEKRRKRSQSRHDHHKPREGSRKDAHNKERPQEELLKRQRAISISSSSSDSDSSSSSKKKKKHKGKHKKHKTSKKKDKKKHKQKEKNSKKPDPNVMSTWTVEFVFRWSEAFAGLQPALKLKEGEVDGPRLGNLLSPDQISQYYDIPQAPASLLFSAVQGQLAKEAAIKEAQEPKKSKKNISTFGEISSSGSYIEAAACKGGPKPAALTARDVLANFRYSGGGKVKMGNALVFTGPEC